MTRRTRSRSSAHGRRAGAVVSAGLVVLAVAISACSSAPSQSSSPPERVSGGSTGHYLVASGIHKIKHIIVIEQENRSFDSYFGTFPGASGIPMQNGEPSVCVPLPAGGVPAALPRHRRRQRRRSPQRAQRRVDVNGGKMDGFIAQASKSKKGCVSIDRSGLFELGRPRRHGLPHGGGDPELLDLRQGLRGSTTTCSSR